jgi:hypothetical protein
MAARVLLLRAKASSAQFDEAVAALKAELGEPVAEFMVDEATAAAAVDERAGRDGAAVIVAVGARAAQLATTSALPSVACMLLRASSVASSPRLASRASGAPRTVIQRL